MFEAENICIDLVAHCQRKVANYFTLVLTITATPNTVAQMVEEQKIFSSAKN